MIPFVTPMMLGGAARPMTLLQMIQAAGLTSSLQVCLDAGDADSYSGSGQTWADVSGNGNSFYLGADNTVESSNDPIFSGTPGACSANEYFTMFSSGARWFTATGSPTWAGNWHRNNATFTVVAVSLNNSALGYKVLFSSSPSTGTVYGVNIYRDNNASRTLSVSVKRGAASAFSADSSAFGASNSSDWRFQAVRLDESDATSGLIFQVNDQQDSPVSGEYTSPASNSASGPYQIGRTGTSSGSKAGDLYAMFAAWNRALSSSELNDLYALIKHRYPTMP